MKRKPLTTYTDVVQKVTMTNLKNIQFTKLENLKEKE